MSQAPGAGRSERFVLAVDLGSTTLKVGLVSLEGAIAWSTTADLQTVRGPDGASTQDADEWWRLVVDAARRGLADGPVDSDHVVAVAVTGQWASTVPVDAAGLPVGPCLMWSDIRGRRHSQAIVGGHVQGYRTRAVAEWVRRTGGIPNPAGNDAVGNLLYLERDAHDIAAAARYYLEPVDYLTMRFTGVPFATHASMFPTWLTDNRRLDVLDYDPTLLRLLDLDRGKLPPLRSSASVVGPVTPEVAREIGIAPDVLVVNGMPDLHVSAVGSGCIGQYQTYLAIATTSWVTCPVPRKKTDLRHTMGSVPGLWRDQYLLANNQRTSARCLEWLRDHVVAPSDGLTPGDPPSYEALVDLAATAPAGSGDVIFTPWLDGENSPLEDASARAGFHNLSLHTGRAHLVRAVLEGVAYNARWLLEVADHFTGRRLEPVRLIGGGVQNDLWCQILADVCDRTVERVADPVLTGLRGAGLYAGLVLDEVGLQELHDLVPVDATFRPDPANRDVYDRLFAEFPRLYKAQRRIFHRLNRS